MGFHGFQKNLILNKNAVSKMNTDGITRFVILYILSALASLVLSNRLPYYDFGLD